MVLMRFSFCLHWLLFSEHLESVNLYLHIWEDLALNSFSFFFFCSIFLFLFRDCVDVDWVFANLYFYFLFTLNNFYCFIFKFTFFFYDFSSSDVKKNFDIVFFNSRISFFFFSFFFAEIFPWDFTVSTFSFISLKIAITHTRNSLFANYNIWVICGCLKWYSFILRMCFIFLIFLVLHILNNFGYVLDIMCVKLYRFWSFRPSSLLDIVSFVLSGNYLAWIKL